MFILFLVNVGWERWVLVGVGGRGEGNMGVRGGNDTFVFRGEN